MAKTLQEWINDDVAALRGKSLKWLSEHHFFRDPSRPIYSDTSYFFAPADGIILYQKVVDPDGDLLDIKGKAYSLRDAMRSPLYARRSLVIGIFMTFYDVHVNRVPLPGRLSYQELEPLDTHNYPMLALEQGLIADARIRASELGYLHNNQRVLNRVYSEHLRRHYYILQIADYDVDSITPFELKQNIPFAQNQRFSQIRYGSQVDLIVPLSEDCEFEPLLASELHVEAGLDPLIRIKPRS